MNSDPVGRKLSAALRAQASGLGAQGSQPQGGQPQGSQPPSSAARHARPTLPAWVVLALAVLLGAMAGGLAGVISTR